jgi:membrane-associated phospholipid phosphatase
MFRFYLPSIVNKENKAKMIIILGSLLMLGYFVAGTFHLGEARTLNFTSIEESIELSPWTTWIYFLLYPYIIWGIWNYKTSKVLNRVAYLYILGQIVAYSIFFFYPTAYPEEMFSVTGNGINEWAWMFLKQVDVPTNCLPSLHVYNCFIVAWGYFDENGKRFLGTFLISVAISISTLTTKQHYLADVVAGFAMATLFYFALGRRIKLT